MPIGYRGLYGGYYMENSGKTKLYLPSHWSWLFIECIYHVIIIHCYSKGHILLKGKIVSLGVYFHSVDLLHIAETSIVWVELKFMRE